MKYFFDTEFIEDGKTIDLISIGIVAEDGREYYAICNEFDPMKASEWVVSNVLIHLPTNKESIPIWKSKKSLKLDILDFVISVGDRNPEFWAYYADYDWVVFCQIFGRMADLPRIFPWYCKDIKQEADRLGVSLSEVIPHKNQHLALEDARWNKKAFEYLERLSL
jgi:hypothetical protein